MQFWPPNFPNYVEKLQHVPKKGSKSQLFCKNKRPKEHISLNIAKLGGQNCIFLLGDQNYYDDKHRGPKGQLRLYINEKET